MPNALMPFTSVQYTIVTFCEVKPTTTVSAAKSVAASDEKDDAAMPP